MKHQWKVVHKKSGKTFRVMDSKAGADRVRSGLNRNFKKRFGTQPWKVKRK